MLYLSYTSPHSLFYFSPLVIACRHEPVDLHRREAPPLLILILLRAATAQQTEVTLRAEVFCWAGRLEYLADTATCYMGWLAAIAVTR
jgi:hypothetical protein